MNRPRHSINFLMWVVGIVALNLAIGQTIFVGEPWRLAGVGLIGATIQVALFFLFRARGQPRHYAFWAGFEAGSLIGLWSFLYTRVPESRVGSLWEDYGACIDGLLRNHYGLSVFNRGPLDALFLATIAFFAFIPQLLMGVGGGLLALCFAWSRRSRVVTITVFATVGFVIANVAAWRAAWEALPAQPPWLVVGVTPSGLMLEWALFRLFQSRGRPRSSAFWVGFIALGSVVLASYVWAMVFTGIHTARYFTYWPGGPSYARPIPESPLWALWIDYTALASFAVGRPPYGTYLAAWTFNPADSLTYALIVLVPHMVVGTAGGLLGRFVAGSLRLSDATKERQ